MRRIWKRKVQETARYSGSPYVCISRHYFLYSATTAATKMPTIATINKMDTMLMLLTSLAKNLRLRQ